MDWLSEPQIWVGLLTLTALEIVLGIDNLVFIAVLVGRVKVERQALARKLGLAASATTAFVERHPTVKMLVFSFLLLIGMTLIADGFGMKVPKGYIYAAIGFSAGVEMLNQFASRRQRARIARTHGVDALRGTR